MLMCARDFYKYLIGTFMVFTVFKFSPAPIFLGPTARSAIMMNPYMLIRGPVDHLRLRKIILAIIF